MANFYLPECTTHTSELPPEESRHASKSLRLKNGDTIRILNGKGLIYKAELENVNDRKCLIRVTDEHYTEAKLPKLTIAISPLKFNDRFEFFIEKAVEMGVYSITPLICKRTEKKHVNLARLERIMIAALKQSGNPHLPILAEPTEFSEFIKSDVSSTRLIAHCEESKKNDLTKMSFSDSITALIGPEGDFTNEETALALTSDYTPITLGPNTLRTESAGLTVCSYFHLLKT